MGLRRVSRAVRIGLVLAAALAAVVLAAYGWLGWTVVVACAALLAAAWLAPAAVAVLSDRRLRSRLPNEVGRTPVRMAALVAVVLVPLALVVDAAIDGVPFAPRCDPAYPDVCIAPPPPQLSCEDVGERAFRALAADPHDLDGDEDGTACEASDR